MPKQILFDAAARNALLSGINQVADAVGATLGPRAGTVLLSRAGLGPLAPPLITKDGVTVARSIALPDPIENEAAKLLQEVAGRTDTEAGDGTTATTVLARELFRSGLKLIAADHDPQAIERGIRAAVAVAVAALREHARPLRQDDLDSLKAIARIASNGDETLAGIIAEAVHKAGVEGSYTLDRSPGPETTLTMAEGFVFKRGFLHPVFCTDPARRTSVFDGANLFLTDRRVIDAKDFRPVLDVYLAHAATVPLIIVAEDIDQGAKQMLLASHPASRESGGLLTCPLRLPPGDDRKDQLEDLAVFTGAKVCSKDRGGDFKSVTFEDFGSADKVIVTPHQTTVVGGHGAPLRIATRRDELRSRIADLAVPEFERLQAERRLATLAGQVAVLLIGSSVQSKLLEKRDRAQDALNATVGALKEGIVPGGGVALLGCWGAVQNALACLSADERAGAQLVADALAAPLRQIAVNCGRKSPDGVVEKVMSSVLNDAVPIGYNAAADRYEDLLAAGIVDPCRVVRLALENAAELAGLLLTTAALVVDLPEEQRAAHSDQRSVGAR